MTQSDLPGLTADAVRFRADLSSLDIASSDELSASVHIVGQPEAIEALDLGLTLRASGYNVFVAGLKGTGRFAASRLMIDQARLTTPDVKSYSYVHNFEEPDRPDLLTLPRGMGRELGTALEGLRNALGEEIPNLLGSEVLAKRRQRLMAKYERETKRIFGSFEEKVGREGFRLAQGTSPTGTIQMADLFPVVQGEAVPMEQVQADPAEVGLDPETVEEMEKRRGTLKEELSSLMARHRQVSARYRRLLSDSELRQVEEAISPLFVEVKDGFASHDPGVSKFLDSALAEMLEHLDLFREKESSEQAQMGPSAEGFLGVFQSNVVFDPGPPGDDDNCPVVEENYPSYRNLFGTIETGADPMATTFLDIRLGSFLRANGGYLLLSARDVLTEPRVYEAIKRTLRKGELEIGPREDSPGPQPALKPEPIPVNVKVILIGEPHTYDLLYASDPDFRKIFKVKVEFDDSMPRTEENVGAFLSVIKRIIDENKLMPFDCGALEALLEEAVRQSGSRERLTTHFSDLGDYMREAAHVAQKNGRIMVTREDQETAVHLHERRTNLAERKMLDLIREGKLLIDVEGSRVGQVNGLAYYDLDYMQFGMPARISATCATGRGGVVNIEREAELSGSIHDKGILILSGFLAAKFATDKPLSLSANIAFEQSYATVDGDSASLAELIALLSSLSDTPIRQDMAVTGSLNQLGAVQPVGGVTEKVQGFYRACRIKGLTGTQGALIPAQNVDELHLDREITEAVESGRFRIVPVSDFKEALHLLTGEEPDKVLDACDKTLARYAEIVRDYS